jgi:hypothetical protein
MLLIHGICSERGDKLVHRTLTAEEEIQPG